MLGGMYDVIVVGARVAGASTALLLARSGLRVLVLERGVFPKDTPNGHCIMAAGARQLQKWGLLDQVLATGCQSWHKRLYEFGPIVFDGTPRWSDGAEAVELAPRRHLIDTLLADAAVVAGAEMRQGFSVDSLLWDDDRVVGIRGHDEAGRQVEERAALVVGADGLHSIVASGVGAGEYETIPAATCIYYSHWSNLTTDALEVYTRPGNYVVVFPSNDGLTCVGVGWPHSAFLRVRANVESEFNAAVDRFPSLSERMRASRREEPLRGMADLPMLLRVPFGPGWALVGDAGCRVDPITGQGMTDALRDAEFLSDAIVSSSDLTGLAAYQRRRDTAVMPMFRFTAQRAQLLPPSPDMQKLLGMLTVNQAEADRFAGLTAGTESIPAFFAPERMANLLAAAA
jgi:flavin-dependent dehydrogenase